MIANKQPAIGVFIDGSNLSWGSLSAEKGKRQQINFSKLKTYFDNKYHPLFLKYYATKDAYPKSELFRRKAQIEAIMHAKLVELGYEVIIKPLKYIKLQDDRFITKGDMDIEITMDIMDNLNSLNAIVLVSGDSDYLKLCQRACEQGQQVIIVSFNKLLSWELRNFAKNNKGCSYTTIESIQHLIMK